MSDIMKARAQAEQGVRRDATAQYLSFLLGSETFAIGILSIREIIEYGQITSVPMTPGYIRGIINLRGAVLPVIDLLALFGRNSSPVSKRSCIVIVEVQGDEERHQIGVVVDAVNAVVDIAASDIEPAPPFGAGVRTEFIQGMGKVDGRFVILLDVRATLGTQGAAAMSALAPPAQAA
jgi:purine-binding chemotaxis protein CheW